MGYNVPTVTQDNFSFGPGVLFASGCGSCPGLADDIGAVRSGAELVITREKITVEQGSPYQRICDYVIRETVVLTVTGIEWNFSNLERALGAGVVSSGTGPGGIAYRKIRFGGDMGVSQASLCYRHHTAEGDEVYVKLWCAIGNGEVTITFGDDVHEFPYGFTAVQPSPLVAWHDDPHTPGGTLADEEHLFEIYREL